MRSFLRLYINSYKGLSPAAWLLALVMLINRAGAMVVPFLGIYMSNELDFTKSQVGIVLGSFGLGSVCGSWIGGWLTDRYGNFKVQASSLIMVIPFFLLASQATTFVALSAVIFCLSLVADTFRPANSVSVASYAKPENITRAYSLNRMALNLGFSIGPALGGFLASFSYKWIFYGNAIGAFIAFLVFIYFFKNRQPNKITSKRTDDTIDLPKKNAYTDTLFIGFNILCFVFSLSFLQLLSTMPLFYKEVKLLSEPELGSLLAFNGFVIVVFEMVTVHYLEKKYSIQRILMGGTFLTGVGFFLMNIDFGLAWLYVAMFILSFGEMLVFPFTSTVTVRRAGTNNQGAYMGFNSLAFAGSLIFSPYLGTYTATHFGYDTLWTICGVLLLLASLGLYIVVSKMQKTN